MRQPWAGGQNPVGILLLSWLRSGDRRAPRNEHSPVPSARADGLSQRDKLPLQEIEMRPLLNQDGSGSRQATARDSLAGMKTRSITEARNSLGRLADAALRGEPTVISRGGKLVVLKAFVPADATTPQPPGFFADCYMDAADIDLENRCGRASD